MVGTGDIWALPCHERSFSHTTSAASCYCLAGPAESGKGPIFHRGNDIGPAQGGKNERLRTHPRDMVLGLVAVFFLIEHMRVVSQEMIWAPPRLGNDRAETAGIHLSQQEDVVQYCLKDG